MNFINESGLYSLVLTSNKPEAKKFKKWITSEVIPSIRKHGIYATDNTIENMIANPDFAIQLLTTLKNERLEKERLLEENSKQVLIIENKEEIIQFLSGKLLDLKDRTFMNELIRNISANLGGFQEAYRNFYLTLKTRLSIDLTLRQKNSKDPKISFIKEKEYKKVVPLLVAWYLKNGGTENFISKLIN